MSNTTVPEEYNIYSAIKPNGDPELLAVHHYLTQEDDFNIKDFFEPKTTKIELEGSIQIEGSVHLLDEYFSVRSD